MFKITVNDKEVKRVLAKIDKVINDFRPLYRSLNKKILAKINKQFPSEGKEFNTPWKQLAAGTIAEKVRLGLNNGILQRSGALRKSFLTKRLTKTLLIIGSSLENSYMKYHQSPDARKSNLPRRPMFEFTSSFVRELNRDIVMFFKRKIE